LKDLDVMQTDGRYEKLTKKERIKLDANDWGWKSTLGHQVYDSPARRRLVIDVRKKRLPSRKPTSSAFR